MANPLDNRKAWLALLNASKLASTAIRDYVNADDAELCSLAEAMEELQDWVDVVEGKVAYATVAKCPEDHNVKAADCECCRENE